MKMFRKLLCSALVVALIAVTMVAAFADTRTVYMRSTDGNSTFGEYVSLDNVKKDSKITSVSSSNTSVMKVIRLNRSTNTNYTYADKKTTTNYGAEFYVNLLKVGSATLSYNLDGAKKTQKFVVKKYTNPISSLVLTGINNNNLKSKFAKGSYGNSISLTKDAKAGKLTVKAASGWKIRSAYWEDYSKNIEYEFYAWGNGVSSCSLNVPKMIKGKSYYVSVSLINTKTKGTNYCSISIH